MIFERGAKEAIERILAAYGFTSRLQLCKQLGVSKSALSNRVFRDNFPADYILQCALETGASLAWLATGQGTPFPDGSKEVANLDEITQPQLKRCKISNSELIEDGFAVFDKSLIPSDVTKPLLIATKEQTYLIDEAATEVQNGLWLVDTDGLIGIKKILRIPAGRIRVSDNDGTFDCGVDDIDLLGKVRLTITED